MILVIDKSRDAALNLADMLHYLGILSRGITPTEALSEISRGYRAAIVTSPSVLPDGRDYMKRLRRYSMGIPIFATYDGSTREHDDLYDLVCSHEVGAVGIAGAIGRFCRERGYPVPGTYLLSGLDASAERRRSDYLGTPLPFTKTECMILRTLISAYPAPIRAERILELAYREKRRPDAANVRTHISVMNKKFVKLFGRNLIYPTFGEGYSILTPERLEAAPTPITV